MDTEAEAIGMAINALEEMESSNRSELNNGSNGKKTDQSDDVSGSGGLKAPKTIDANTFITSQIYDDEHEEWKDVHMTIAEYLDAFTDEGCPETIEKTTAQREKVSFDEIMRTLGVSRKKIEEWFIFINQLYMVGFEITRRP